MPFRPLNLLSVAVAFGLALGLTPLVRAFARRFGLVAKPKSDRWHKKPTAMLGGVAIWLSVVISYLLFFRPNTLFGFDSSNLSLSYSWVIITPALFSFWWGLLDDLLHTKPYQKLIGQIMGLPLLSIRSNPAVDWFELCDSCLRFLVNRNHERAQSSR